MNDEPVRILVLSDLHAFSENKELDWAPSMLNFGDGGANAKNLFEQCLRALERAEIREVDVVVCPGDIAHAASPSGLTFAWKELVGLSERLNAPLVATAGNHDYRSRGDTEASPRESLVGLDPLFPFDDDSVQMHYFTHDFSIVELERLSVVTLNSAAHHGLVYNDVPEYEHGRIGKHTLRKLKEVLSTLETTPRLNVLVTHHHIAQLPHLDVKEQSKIRDVEQLTKVLEDDGVWLIIHGHKHRGWIYGAQGGGNAPIVFAAGSFSADLGGLDFGNSVRNQFHVIELQSTERADDLEIKIAGRFRSWTWDGERKDWQPSQSRGDGLPGAGGFGWETSPDRVAQKLLDEMRMRSKTRLDLSEILENEPRFQYLPPADVRRVVDRITASGSDAIVEFDDTGEISHIICAKPSAILPKTAVTK
jgi:predicted phosphodiesterase